MPEIRQDIRSVTFVVAADDSLHKNMADYACSGVSDQVEINLALNALPAGGGSVKLLEGTYTIDDPIIIPGNNITLIGEGNNTFIDGDGLATTEHGIVISAMENITIEDLAIQTEDGGGKTCHCIFIEDSSNNFTIRRVTVINSDSDCIHIEGTTTSDGRIIDCDIIDMDDYGIFVDMDAGSYCDRLTISDCTVFRSGLDGIHFGLTGTGHRYCVIQANHINAATLAGININNADNSIVSNNKVESCLQEGIHVDSSAQVKIEGNQVSWNNFYGMWLDESDYSIIANNVFYYNDGGGATYSGLYVTETEHASITGNSCNRNGLHGILMLRCNNCSVVGNTCADQTTGEGIHVTGDGTEDSNYNEIIGNNCSGNEDDGIEIEGGTDAVGNAICGNEVTWNGDHGINVAGADTQIEGNYIFNNSQNAAGTYHGINLGATSDRCMVNNNNCSSDGSRQEDGIHLEDGANEAQIVGNYCYNGMGSGIALTANNDTCLIEGNVCSTNDDYGIEIAAASCGQNKVKENKLYGNTTGAILDNGTQTGLPWHFEPVPNPDSFIGTHPATVLTDGLAVLARLEVFLPIEFQELVRATAVLVPGGSGDLRREVATNWGEIGSGEIYNSDSGAIAAGEVAVTLNHTEAIDISAAFVGVGALGPGDIIGVEFTRHGNHANDTVGADCYLIGVRLQYV